jgi:hypothetical protein
VVSRQSEPRNATRTWLVSYEVLSSEGARGAKPWHMAEAVQHNLWWCGHQPQLEGAEEAASVLLKAPTNTREIMQLGAEAGAGRS